jgi:hypothetical protein
VADSTELCGHWGEAERLPIGASSDTNQDEGDTSTRESASAGDGVKPVLCPIGGCRFGDGNSVCCDRAVFQSMKTIDVVMMQTWRCC